MKSFKIFHLLLILFKIEIIICTSKCGTDTLKIRPKKLNLTSKVETSSIKSTNSDSYTPIKIGYDFTTLKKPSTMNATIFSDVKSILKETREEFSKILQVQHKDFDLTNKLNEIKYYCDLNTIGTDYPNFLIRNDLIIFPMFYSFSEGILAAAAPCIIDENNRPFGGVLYINKKLDFNKVNTKLYMKNLLLHEITHILAFHPNLFSNLNMIEKIYSRSYIISSNALAKAKEHYNCSSIIRIPLENQGGSGSVGSHWESRYMLGDYMISTDYPDQAISDITLGLFEDTGFYKVNYYSGGLFKFGKGKGCEFFNKDCIENDKATFDEFCDTAKEAMCTSSRAIKSSCYITTYDSNLPSEYQHFSDPKKGGIYPTNYCPVPYSSHSSNNYFSNHCQFGTSSLSSQYGETIGSESLCFMSSLLPESSSTTQNSRIPICYEVKCDTSNNKIIVKVGSSSVTCPTEGGTVNSPSGFKGSIECPKYSEMCASNDGIICNEMFDCFTKLANKGNNNYETSYHDYSSSTNDYTNDEVNKNNEDIEDDEDQIILRANKVHNIKINLAFLLYYLFLVFN
jgi:leishmanolysin